MINLMDELLRRPLDGEFISIKLLRESGALPCIILKASEVILQMILELTGSQCSDFNTGVICENMDVVFRIWAATFWIR